MEQEKLAPPADLFEYVEIGRLGPVPKKVDPRTRGVMSRYFLSFVDGFVSRMGGKLRLFSKDNTSSSTIGQEGQEFVLEVAGIPVLRATKRAVRVSEIEVGGPDLSYITMYSGGEKVYLHVTPKGKIGVRKTPPPRIIAE